MLAIRARTGVARRTAGIAWKSPRTAASEASIERARRTHRRETVVAGRSTSSMSAPRPSVYRELAARRDGEEREILTRARRGRGPARGALADTCSAESPTGCPARSAARVLLGWMARRFGSIFVLALAQNAEARSPYESEPFATPTMAADEKIHHEVVRGLAARGRRRLSGTFRAAVFGANDGLVSNLALVMGIGATGVAAAVRALQRHRRPSRRCPVDGRGGVRLGPLAA